MEMLTASKEEISGKRKRIGTQAVNFGGEHTTFPP